jgi:hypothetical protein
MASLTSARSPVRAGKHRQIGSPVAGLYVVDANRNPGEIALRFEKSANLIARKFFALRHDRVFEIDDRGSHAKRACRHTWNVRACGDPPGALCARSNGRRACDHGIAIRRHGGLDERSISAIPLFREDAAAS